MICVWCGKRLNQIELEYYEVSCEECEQAMQDQRNEEYKSMLAESRHGAFKVLNGSKK